MLLVSYTTLARVHELFAALGRVLELCVCKAFSIHLAYSILSSKTNNPKCHSSRRPSETCHSPATRTRPATRPFLEL